MNMLRVQTKPFIIIVIQYTALLIKNSTFFPQVSTCHMDPGRHMGVKCFFQFVVNRFRDFEDRVILKKRVA